MSTVEDVLEHVGVKGMHWGVRRDPVTGVRPSAKALDESAFGKLAKANVNRYNAKKAAKADKKWQKNIYSVKGAVAVHNHVADAMNGGVLDKLNNDPRFKDIGTSKNSDKLMTKYFKAYGDLVEHHTALAVKQIHGVSPSGKLKATLDVSDPSQWKVRVSPTKGNSGPTSSAGFDVSKSAGFSTKTDDAFLIHEDTPLPELIFELNHEANGHITSMRKINADMTQSDIADLGLDFLEHVGVKGMHWGVRRSKPTAKEQRIRSSREKILNRRRQLSEGDLKKFIERLDNEKKLKTLIEQDIKPGKSAAKRIMSESGQKVAKAVVAGAGLYAVKSILEKKFDPKEAAKFLAPTPKNK